MTTGVLFYLDLAVLPADPQHGGTAAARGGAAGAAAARGATAAVARASGATQAVATASGRVSGTAQAFGSTVPGTATAEETP